MTSRKRPKLVLAIYFQTSGFGFVLLEHWFSPIDWGAPEVRGTDRAKRCLKQIDALLALHTPDILILQDMSRRGTRRTPRIQNLNRQTLLLAKRRGVPVRTFSRAQVLDYFRGVRSNDQAAHRRDHRKAHSRSQPLCPAPAQTVEE